MPTVHVLGQICYTLFVYIALNTCKSSLTYTKNVPILFSLFELMLYISVNNFSIMLGCFPGLKQYKAVKIKCLAQGHNTMPQVSLKVGTS